MMNKVILVGRLTRDPEVQYTTSGKAVASFSLAVDRIGSGQADFIPIVVWEKLAEVCGNNLTKGRLILVEGRLQIRSYETKEGQKRTIAEIVAQNIQFLERKQGTPTNKESAPEYNMNTFGKTVMPDEEIPF